MASKFKLESLEERAERMVRDNPGRPIELCTAVVLAGWGKKAEAISARIPERFANAEIEDLGYMMEAVTDAVGEILSPVGVNDKVGVVLTGPAGSGKTYSMYAIINRLKEKNPDMVAYVTTYSNLMTSLKSEFAHDTHDEIGSMWDRLSNESGMYNGVLFIDDLSSQKLTDFEVDKLMMFLDIRLNSYMPFVITTNVKSEDFGKVFGERLASRLLGYSVIVQFDDVDKRSEEEIV